MASGIEAQDEGETKSNDIATFNTIVPMFSAARETPGLRDFLAKLFGSLDAYYKNKKRRRRTVSWVPLGPGDVILFDGDVAHAGSGYKTGTKRILIPTTVQHSGAESQQAQGESALLHACDRTGNSYQ